MASVDEKQVKASEIEKQIKEWLGPNRTEAARSDYGNHIVIVSHPDGQKQQFAVGK